MSTKRKKIMGCIIVYNEMSILPYSLPFWIDALDGHLIIDGGPQGTSDDGTWEWLKDNYANNSKVHLITGTFGDHTREGNWNKVMRNFYLQKLDEYNPEDAPDWIFVHDADEAVDSHFISEMRREINNADDSKIMLRFPYHQFFKDFHHEYKGYDHIDKFSHHLTKYFHGMRYRKKNSWLYHPNGSSFEAFPKECNIMRSDLYMYHYSHAEGIDKMRYREWRYGKRGDLKSIPKENDYKDYNYVDRRTTNSDAIVKFNGDHPSYMIPYIEKEYKKREIKI